MYACGTILRNRVGYPQQLKDIKQFNKTAARGGMRWVRMTDILCVQWKDNRVISILLSILLSIHTDNKETTAIRRTKVNGKYAKLEVRQPEVFTDYNKQMGGVDKSDQLISRYNTLRKTKKFARRCFSI